MILKIMIRGEEDGNEDDVLVKICSDNGDGKDVW